MDTAKQTIAGKVIQLGDVLVPPRIESLSFWRSVLSGEIAEYNWAGAQLKQFGYIWGKSTEDDTEREIFGAATRKMYKRGSCGFCDTAGTRIDPEFGYYYCLCWLLEQKEAWAKACSDWGSNWAHQTVDQMDMKAPPKGLKDLRYAIDRTSGWIEYPDKWLVYSGPTGTGKTHLINSIMAEWYPYAMYVVTSDFEDRLRSYLSGKSNKIQPYITALMNHPILCLDDLGIEHTTPWIAAKLDALIEYRSRMAHWWDHLTVVGTNIRHKDIKRAFVRDGVSRIGSRLIDTEMVDWIHFSEGGDYRGLPK